MTQVDPVEAHLTIFLLYDALPYRYNVTKRKMYTVYMRRYTLADDLWGYLREELLVQLLLNRQTTSLLPTGTLGIRSACSPSSPITCVSLSVRPVRIRTIGRGAGTIDSSILTVLRRRWTERWRSGTGYKHRTTGTERDLPISGTGWRVRRARGRVHGTCWRVRRRSRAELRTRWTTCQLNTIERRGDIRVLG